MVTAAAEFAWGEAFVLLLLGMIACAGVFSCTMTVQSCIARIATALEKIANRGDV